MAKKRKSNLKWLVTGVLVAVVAGVTLTFLMKPALSPYESVVAKTGDITTYYSFSGNVETKDRQTVTSEKVLQVSKILVNEGDIVKEGTVLMKTTAGAEIKSKIRGEIVNLNVEVDDQVMAGTKLLDIVDYDNLEIKVKVDEYDLAALEKGKEATIKIGAINQEIKGNISSIAKEGQILNGVTFFTATIDLEDNESIRNGMSAEVKIISNQVSDVVTLPMTALQFNEYNEPYILKQGESDTVVQEKLTTGINDGITVEVKSGIVSGETILYTKTAATAGLGFPSGGMNGTGGNV